MTTGFEAKSGKMDGTGSIVLIREKETHPAAVWQFSDLLKHWSRKHAKAVYVPSMCRRQESLAYRFANVVRLGEGVSIKWFDVGKNDWIIYAENPGCGFKDVRVSRQVDPPVVGRVIWWCPSV